MRARWIQAQATARHDGPPVLTPFPRSRKKSHASLFEAQYSGKEGCERLLETFPGAGLHLNQTQAPATVAVAIGALCCLFRESHVALLSTWVERGQALLARPALSDHAAGTPEATASFAGLDFLCVATWRARPQPSLAPLKNLTQSSCRNARCSEGYFGGMSSAAHSTQRALSMCYWAHVFGEAKSVPKNAT